MRFIWDPSWPGKFSVLSFSWAEQDLRVLLFLAKYLAKSKAGRMKGKKGKGGDRAMGKERNIMIKFYAHQLKCLAWLTKIVILHICVGPLMYAVIDLSLLSSCYSPWREASQSLLFPLKDCLYCFYFLLQK